MALHQSKIYRALGGAPRKLDALCELMASGKSARELMDWIAAEGRARRPAEPPPELTDQNITDFRQGHFARWQARREAAQALRERAAAARRLVSEARAEGASITEAAALSAAATISEALETYTAGDLRARFSENPGDFFKAVGSLAQISRAELARKELEQRAARLEADLTISEERRAALVLANEKKCAALLAFVSAAEKKNGGKLTGAEVRAKIKELYGF
jgi:hypothetical protein